MVHALLLPVASTRLAQDDKMTLLRPLQGLVGLRGAHLQVGGERSHRHGILARVQSQLEEDHDILGEQHAMLYISF